MEQFCPKKWRRGKLKEIKEHAKKNWNRTKIRFDQDLSFLEANGVE